jgi:hypothetical protein
VQQSCCFILVLVKFMLINTCILYCDVCTIVLPLAAVTKYFRRLLVNNVICCCGLRPRPRNVASVGSPCKERIKGEPGVFPVVIFFKRTGPRGFLIYIFLNQLAPSRHLIHCLQACPKCLKILGAFQISKLVPVESPYLRNTWSIV